MRHEGEGGWQGQVEAMRVGQPAGETIGCWCEALLASQLTQLTCIRIAASPSPEARSGASKRGNSVASVTVRRG